MSNKGIKWLPAFTTFLALISTITLGQPLLAKKEPALIISNKKVSLAELKNQFKSIRVTIPHNPAYEGKEKTYDAFEFNQILTELMNVDLKKDNRDQLLLVLARDKYVSQIPLSYFTTKGQAYLAYQEAPDTILANNITQDGRWSFVRAQGKKDDPGPFYIVWNNTNTYPTAWPYQIVSLKVVNKKELTFNKFLNPSDQSLTIKQGHKIFNNVCSACHSLFYQGAVGRAPDLGMVTSYLHPTDITRLVKNGRGYMPAIGKNFTTEDINSLIDYLSWVSKQSSKIKCH